jgi:hypothetical protein
MVHTILTSMTRSGGAIEWPGASAGRAKALEPTDPIASANKAALTMIVSDVLSNTGLVSNPYKLFRLQTRTNRILPRRQGRQQARLEDAKQKGRFGRRVN